LESLFDKIVYTDLPKLINDSQFKAALILIENLEKDTKSLGARYEEEDIKLLIDTIKELIEILNDENTILNKEHTLFELYAYLRCYEKSAGIISKIVNDNPNNILFLDEATSAYYFARDYKKSLEYASALIELDPFNTTGLSLSAICHAYFDDADSVLYTLEKLIINNLNTRAWWIFCRKSVFRKYISYPTFFIKIYEENKKKIKHIEVLLFIQECFARFCFRNNDKEACKKQKYILDSLIRRDPNNSEISVAFSKYWDYKGDHQKALNHAIKAIEKSDDEDANLNLARLYQQYKDYPNSAYYYKKVISMNKSYAPYQLMQLLSVLRLYNINEYSQYIDDAISKGELSVLINEFLSVRKTVEFEQNPDLYSRILDLDYIKNRMNLRKIRGEETFIVKLFETTNHFPDRKECRLVSIDLYEAVLNLKQRLIYSRKDRDICHYSKIESMKYLLAEDHEKARFRINNIAYMNDPSEGITFIELLKKFNVSEEIINILYPSVTSSENKDLYYSDTYLASFTLSKDKLPMWTQYGADGTGCCYVLNDTLFINRRAEIDMPNLWQDDGDLKSNNVSLYKVEYIDIQNVDYLKGLNHSFRKSIKELSDCIVRITDWIEKYTEMKNMVVSLLDQIRFLYKDTAYVHEDEVRIVVMPKPDEVKITGFSENYIVPKLYVELDKTLNFKEIILGPKVSRPSEIVPFILHSQKVKKVTLSKIKYR
jgi:tetratricopeptide (TPR) repeat protein